MDKVLLLEVRTSKAPDERLHVCSNGLQRLALVEHEGGRQVDAARVRDAARKLHGRQ